MSSPNRRAAFPRVVALLPCSEIRRSEDSGVSLIGVFYGFEAQALPFTVSELLLYLCVECVPSKPFLLEVAIESPDADVISEAAAQVLECPKGWAEIDLKFYDVIFPTLGDYVLRISSRGRAIYQRPLQVRRAP